MAARLVRLRRDSATVATLGTDEIVWDPAEPEFRLAPSPHRSFRDVDEVEVIYAVTTVSQRLHGTRSTTLVFSGAGDRVAEARALAAAVVTLDSARLRALSATTYERDGRRSTETIRQIELLSLPATVDDRPEIRLRFQVEIEVGRALRPDEGAPIRRITSPHTAATGPVAVEPAVG